MHSCLTDIRTFVLEAEKDKHQNKEMKAKKVKNKNKPKVDRAEKKGRPSKRKNRMAESKQSRMAEAQPWHLRVIEDALLITRKNISHPKIIYAQSKERFGEKQNKKIAVSEIYN